MSYQNARKNAVIRAIFAILAVVGGVVAFFIAHALIKDEKVALRVLKSLGIGTVVFLMVIGMSYSIFSVLYKRKVFAVISTACTWVSVIIILLVCSVKWWIVLIIAVAMFMVCALVLMGAYSDQLTVVPDNAKPDYKDYNAREAERAATPEQKQEEELPKIKSFE